MRKQFFGYYRPTEEEFNTLWENCTFIFDTNILLNMYRYSDDVRNKFFLLLNRISKRIWIPHQVALEYQQNRLTVIAEQFNKYDEVIKIVNDCEKSLLNKLGNLESIRFDSTIYLNTYIEKFQSITKDFSDQTISLKQKQPNYISFDPIREQIDNILSGNIGEPYSSEHLDQLYKEGEKRYKYARPPGYRDFKKLNNTGESQIDNCYFSNNEMVIQKFGDLLIWKQIIKHIQEEEIKHIILVTDDKKDDWWWIENGKLLVQDLN